ncbi:hypothetical protein NCC78_07120 [Micromonospora phytophila]|uniref:hypothetical protein n=1 Tax=Micromonospora phytophila TaxID=709888 RepID=UPI0020300D60|nr:hypothetical protein [Micromonospora phytophila]MCM0674458.1 hypothetical protein [Micromonospora phytophila]
MKSLGSRVLLAHAAIVLVLVAAFLAMDASADGPTVAVGLMLPGLPLLALGLPWSAAFFNADDPLTKSMWLVLALGPAVFNVVIHGLIRLVLVATRSVDAGT